MIKSENRLYFFCIMGLFLFNSCDLFGMFERLSFGLFSSAESINQRDHDGQTQLHRAVNRLYLLESVGSMVVGLLLNKGADPNIKDYTGRTPLHCAVDINHEFMVKILLNYGASINEQDKAGDTPLHLAVIWNRLHLEKFLIEAGADENILNCSGFSAMTLAHDSLRRIIENDVAQRAKKQNKENADRVALLMRCRHEFLQDLQGKILEYL